MSLSGHTYLQSQYSFMLHYKSVRNMQFAICNLGVGNLCPYNRPSSMNMQSLRCPLMLYRENGELLRNRVLEPCTEHSHSLR